MNEIYLDNSATTKISEKALEKYIEISNNFYANPSALHKSGFNAEKEIENARKIVMKAFGAAKEKEVIFTSGGTESDNIAILGTVLARKREGKHVITSKTEHHAVLDCFKFLESQGFEVTYLDVDNKGIVDLNQLKNCVTDKTILISIMTMNNETGAVQPINEIKKLSKNATLHTDAVQALGKIDLSAINADLISVSSHKIHGPKGVGALYIKAGTKIKNTVFGGGQEWNLRSGTLNTPGICAFSVAVEEMLSDFEVINKKYHDLYDYFIEKLSSIENISFNTHSKCNIINVSFHGVRGEVLLHYLEDKNIFISTGSACNSKSTKTSYVLDAMGIEKNIAEGAVRISLSKYNTFDEIDRAVHEIICGLNFLRKFKRR